MRTLLVIGVLVVPLAAIAPSARGQPTSCFVSSVPSPAGPAAPTDLTASLAPTQGGYAVDLAWTDNATGETCYVIERALGANAPPNYTVLATLAQGSTAYHDPGPYGYPSEAIALYRIYAAIETARSDYSNEAYTIFPVPDGTPSPSPSPTPSSVATMGPTPTSAPGTSAPTPSPSRSPSPITAGLPHTGGYGDGKGFTIWEIAAGAAVAVFALAAGVLSITRLAARRR